MMTAEERKAVRDPKMGQKKPKSFLEFLSDKLSGMGQGEKSAKVVCKVKVSKDHAVILGDLHRKWIAARDAKGAVLNAMVAAEEAAYRAVWNAIHVLYPEVKKHNASYNGNDMITLLEIKKGGK